MRTPRIHTPQPLVSGQTVTLDDNAFNHAVRVLRLGEGDAIILFNGEGGQFEAHLSDVNRKQARATVGAHADVELEPPLKLIMGQCISRGEKMDYTIQKSVELGISEITPLSSTRCGVQLKGERLEKRLNHWQSVAISAAEQSGRNRTTPIRPLMSLAAWVEKVEADLKLVLEPSATQALGQLPPPQHSVALLFGPEGGMTQAEIELALRHGFTAIRLGPRILRTETASLATLSAIQTLWGDLGKA